MLEEFGPPRNGKNIVDAEIVPTETSVPTKNAPIKTAISEKVSEKRKITKKEFNEAESKEYRILYESYRDSIDKVKVGSQGHGTLNKKLYTSKILSILNNLKNERANEKVKKAVEDDLKSYSESLTNENFSPESEGAFRDLGSGYTKDRADLIKTELVKSKEEFEAETAKLKEKLVKEKTPDGKKNIESRIQKLKEEYNDSLNMDTDQLVNKRISAEETRELLKMDRAETNGPNKRPATEKQIELAEELLNKKLTDKEKEALTQDDITKIFNENKLKKSPATKITKAQSDFIKNLTKKAPHPGTSASTARSKILELKPNISKAELNKLEGKENFFSNIYQKFGKMKDPNDIISKDTSSVKEFSDKIREGYKNSKEGSYERGYFTAIGATLKKAFGAGWAENPKLNKYLSMDTREGKAFWDKLFSYNIKETSSANTNALNLMQRKSVVEKIGSNIETQSKPYSMLNKGDIFAREAKTPETLSKKTMDQVREEFPDASIRYGEDIGLDNITDISQFNAIHPGLSLAEIGKTPTAIHGISDGYSLATRILSAVAK
jgi:hypothetical protein